MIHGRCGKFVLCALVLLLIASSTAVAAAVSDDQSAAGADVKADGVTYEISDKGYASVIDVDDAENISIPSTICKDDTTYQVKSIASRAFSRCVSMTSVSLPDSIVSIDDYAFMGCRSLTGITIPGSTGYISCNAFIDCKSLASITVSEKNTKYAAMEDVLFELNGKTPVTLVKYPAGKTDETYDVPNTVKTIGTNAFSLNHNIKKITTSSVSVISDRAFEGCLNLERVKLSYSTASIGDMAFLLCTNLRTIDIPANVNSISGTAFNGCSSLEAIAVDDDNGCFCSVDGVLFDKNKTVLMIYPAGKTDVSEYAVPDTVKQIGTVAFAHNKALKTIVIPSSTIRINVASFSGCVSLESIRVNADNPKYCDADGVLFTKDMTEIVKYPIARSCGTYIVPETVTTIGSYSFCGCKNIEGIHLSKSVQYIKAFAFYGSSMKAVTVDSDNGSFCSDDGVLYTKDMSRLCFYPTGKTDSTFTVPESVVRFGTQSDNNVASCGLSNNTYLKNIIVNDNDNYKSVDGLVYSKDGTMLLLCPAGKTEVSIPSGTETIAAGAFINSLTSSLTIPDNVTVSTGALLNCTSLKTIKIEGNNVVFDYLSVDFSDVTGSYKITAEAPSGYMVPATAYTANVTFSYTTSSGASDNTWFIIIVSAIVLLAVAAVVVTVVCRGQDRS